MNQQTSKECDINQVTAEHALLHLCLDKFPSLEGKVEQSQLKKMQNKYQFYLRKFNKISEEFNKYKELYENIEKTIEESPQIIEENRSIDFINKVMEETFRNYNKLKESVDSMKLKKETNQHEKVRLKNILLKMKGEYFELQRKQEEFLENKKIENVHSQSKQNFRHMFKIRQEKKSRQKSPKIKPIEMNKLTMDVSFAEKRIISELDTINSLKEEFLTLIGTNLKDFYKGKERELNSREKNNKLIFKKNLPLRQSQKKKEVRDYQPQNEVFSVHRILNEYQNEEEEFMKLDNVEIIEMILKKDKVNDMLHLIEEQKRGMIEAYRKNKIDQFRSN